MTNAGADIGSLAAGITTIVLTLLVIAAWRMRFTPVGRSHLGLLLLFQTATVSSYLESNAMIGPETWLRVNAVLYQAITVLVLRLACQAREEAQRLPTSMELLIWTPSILLGGWGNAQLGALWCTLAFAIASLRIAGMPIRSWPGYRRSVHVVSGALLLPMLVSLFWLVGWSAETLTLLARGSFLAVAAAFTYGLPRLGLLSSDRVQHGSVIEAMSDGVLVVDLNGRLVDFNEAAGRILSLDPSCSTGSSVRDVLAHHPDLVELFSGAIDGRSVYTPVAPEGAGEARTYDLQLSAICDATGTLQSRVLVLRDITDRIAIEREHRRQSRQVRLVHEVSASVHEAESIDAGLEAALGLIGNSMGFSAGQFLRCLDDSEGNALTPSGILFVAEESGIDLDDVDPAREGWWKELGLGSVHVVPVLVGRRLHGVFELYALEAIVVDDVTVELLEHVGDLVGRAIERKLVEEKIRRLAYRDDLTGLPNRQHFQQLLASSVARAGRSDRRMALLFMDLDGFKKVNDSLGHEMGDRLLAEVASRFSLGVRAGDHIGRARDPSQEEHTISRLGGDEFTVLLTEIKRPADAALVAERLLRTLERPVVLGGQELFVSTSIGVAVFPEDGVDAESLLRNADAAMYFAKGRGRNRYQFYSREMNRTHSGRIELEARLRGAIERGEFDLHYQPILEAATGEVVAAEALVRWIDADGRSVSPDEFIPVAEETGLIVPLGRWVFQAACARARAWEDAGMRPIRIGVNVSGHQIREPGMVDMVRSALEHARVPPDRLELEITESTIMQNDALTERTLRDLREMGIGLALDDFGTGYSSLSYLRRFTIDRVKVDRSFVRDLPESPDDAALTSAIIAMAHGLRVKVVAEGVETTRQAMFLEQRGCDELQGYLFGRPCDAEAFVDLLRARPAPRPIRELEKTKDAEPPAR